MKETQTEPDDLGCDLPDCALTFNTAARRLFKTVSFPNAPSLPDLPTASPLRATDAFRPVEAGLVSAVWEGVPFKSEALSCCD